MTTQLPNIDYGLQGESTIDSPSSEVYIPFLKNQMYFSSIDNEVRFVKAVEALVRSHPDYKRYVKIVRESLGLTYCQVMSNISDAAPEGQVTERLLDMHHGPVLNLFDTVSIITRSLVNKGIDVTTFMVAEITIDEHFEHNVQVTMLSETVHEQVHQNTIFLNMKHGHGDINAFLTKYKNGLNNSLIRKINDYIERSKANESYDTGVLTLNRHVSDWSGSNSVF